MGMTMIPTVRSALARLKMNMLDTCNKHTKIKGKNERVIKFKVHPHNIGH
jgi:hypothetical protein